MWAVSFSNVSMSQMLRSEHASLSVPMDWTCGQASPHLLPRLIYCLNMKSSLAENMRVILGWEQAPTIFNQKKWQKLLLLLVKLFPLSSQKLTTALFQSWSKVLHEMEQRVVFYTNLDIRKAHMLPKCEKQQCHKIIYGLAVITHFTPLQTLAYAGKKMVLGLNNIKGYFVF